MRRGSDHSRERRMLGTPPIERQEVEVNNMFSFEEMTV